MFFIAEMTIFSLPFFPYLHFHLAPWANWGVQSFPTLFKMKLHFLNFLRYCHLVDRVDVKSVVHQSGLGRVLRAGPVICRNCRKIAVKLLYITDFFFAHHLNR